MYFFLIFKDPNEVRFTGFVTIFALTWALPRVLLRNMAILKIFTEVPKEKWNTTSVIVWKK